MCVRVLTTLKIDKINTFKPIFILAYGFLFKKLSKISKLLGVVGSVTS